MLTSSLLQIGVPGAFTTPCNAHLPGYIENYEKFKEKGVNGIYVFGVNDAFVMKFVCFLSITASMNNIYLEHGRTSWLLTGRVSPLHTSLPMPVV